MKKKIFITLATLILCLGAMVGLMACDTSGNVDQKIIMVTGFNTTYNYGDVVDYSNAKIHYVDSNGDVQSVALTSEMINVDSKLPGDHVATVNYNGMTYGFEYSVNFNTTNAVDFIEDTRENFVQNVPKAKFAMEQNGETQYMYINENNNDTFAYSCISNTSSYGTWTRIENGLLYNYSVEGNVNEKYLIGQTKEEYKENIIGNVDSYANYFTIASAKIIDNNVQIVATYTHSTFTYNFVNTYKVQNINGKSMSLISNSSYSVTNSADSSDNTNYVFKADYDYISTEHKALPDVTWKNYTPTQIYTDTIYVDYYNSTTEQNEYKQLTLKLNQEVDEFCIKVKTISAGDIYLDLSTEVNLYNYITIKNNFDTTTAGNKVLTIEMLGVTYNINYTVTQN